MSTLKITFTILLSILLISLSSCNPTPDPESVVKSWNDALNEGDVDAALEYLDDNATITIIPPPAGMSGVFTGKEQIRAWYEGNAALNGFNELVEIHVNGDMVNWTSKFGMDEWRNIGVESLDILGEGVIVDGKFQSYTITIPPESLAKLPPPPDQASTTEPESVFKSWNDALNEGDVDAALEYLDDNATITIIPPPAGMSGVFTGKEQIRAWYEGNAALNGFNELVEIHVNGDMVNWTSKFGMDEWRNIGVESLDILGEGVIVDGKFQSYTITIPPESLAKLPPPPDQAPTTEPVEVSVTEIEDMVGIWSGRAMGDSGYHKFNQDGTFTVAWNMSDLEANPSATAEYWFEGTVFHVNDGCGHGTYEVKIKKEGDRPARLIFKLIEDPCGPRINDWKSGMRWFEQ